ncbi:MAG: aminopeptidase P family protein [Acidobacteriia bacterium]|nr:aminopeptidase P family protein [Terriglobia bacterium]
MRRTLLAIFIVLQLATAFGRAAVSPELAERREKLRKNMPDGVLVLFGAKESEDLHEGFYQEPNFYYLTGWEEPGAILVLTPEVDKDEPALPQRAKLPREILFLPQRVPSKEKWTGRKLGPSDPGVAQTTGFANVMPAERFESELRTILEAYPDIYALSSANATINRIAPLRTIVDAFEPIAKLRMRKSPAEITAIQRATDASVEAHKAAWRVMRPGLVEYEVAAVMVGSYMMDGCRRSAYAPIVGSGPNSTVLHYSRNNRKMDSGEVTVMDVAAECGNYASDITRTVPVNGKFTPRQREIYEIVLGAQKAAIAAIKPGMTMYKTTPNSIYQVAFDYINTHGKDLHGQPLGKYFNHGLSHHVGLDVHDADAKEPLEPGMVITVEPGIYIPEENLGIRIEDVILVTEKGAKNLSEALPRDTSELERALARQK